MTHGGDVVRIEKINDDQIKITLSREDLIERNLQFNELSFIDPETVRGFFMEMMEQVVVECGFQAELNTPLFIDVVPVASDGIMLIVTKITSEEQVKQHIETKLNFLPFAKELRRFRQRPIIEPKKTQNESSNIFCFKSLEELAMACRAVNGLFGGQSQLFKFNSKYYLVLAYGKKQQNANMNLLLNEFGYKITASAVSPIYLSEHGEMLINEGAVGIAAAYL
jgi:adapter protein MecA 1/2